MGGIAVSAVFSLALLPVAPSLLGRDPVLLEALRGSTPAMVASGAFARVGEASLLLALVAPVATLVVFDPFYWWAGRLWGPTALATLAGGSPRARRSAARAGRLAERFGSLAVVLSYFLPVPSVLVYAAVGMAGMRFRRFLALDLVSASLWIATNVGLGYAIGQGAVDVARAISRYALFVTLALVVVVFVLSFRRARREPEWVAGGVPEPGGGPEPRPSSDG